MFDVLKRLDELRSSKNLSVYALSKKSGIAQSTIATWYSKNLCPPIDKLERICDGMGISLCDFFRSGDISSGSEEEAVLMRYRDLLTAEERKAVLTLMETILKNRGLLR